MDGKVSLHKKEWGVQRTGWVLMYVSLMLPGFLGERPLSARQMQAGSIEVVYERLIRYGHTTEIKFRSTGDHIDAVAIPQEYLANFRLDKVVPRESRQTISANYVNFVFEESSNEMVTFYLIPVQRKIIEGIFKINNYSFLIQQTIYS